MKINTITDEGVEVPGDSLDGADLRKARLHRALLERASMRSSSLEEADLRGAFLTEADLTGANLQGASLATAALEHAILQRSTLVESLAVGARFNFARLDNADLTGADVAFSDFAGSSLRGARMLCKRLGEASLKDARYDDATVWPPGFDPAAAGAVLILDVTLPRDDQVLQRIVQAILSASNFIVEPVTAFGEVGSGPLIVLNLLARGPAREGHSESFTPSSQGRVFLRVKQDGAFQAEIACNSDKDQLEMMQTILGAVTDLRRIRRVQRLRAA